MKVLFVLLLIVTTLFVIIDQGDLLCNFSLYLEWFVIKCADYTVKGIKQYINTCMQTKLLHLKAELLNCYLSKVDFCSRVQNALKLPVLEFRSD